MVIREITELIKKWINDQIGYDADKQEFKENNPKLYKALTRLLWEIEH